MVFNRKIEIEFPDEDARRLDGQSKICNWLYNHLLEMSIDDYKNNDGQKKLLSGRTLRNQIPDLKKEFPFLKAVHSSLISSKECRIAVKKSL